MIAIRLIGGLGNQMFQYACGRALAERMGTQLYADLSAFKTYQLHEYGLDSFQADIVKTPAHLSTGTRVWAVLRRLGISPAAYFRLLDTQWIHEGGDLSYQPQRLVFEGSAYLDGYWQCERYFNDFEDRIRGDFRLEPKLQQQLAERRQQSGIGCSNTVSLHVRRGDYITDQTAQATHGSLGEDYYRKAVEYLTQHLGGTFRLLVFSDDIAWARDNLRLPAQTVFVEPHERSPQIDMHLMASCDHHVIANSSFSWWGAWLNPSATKTVIAPARWFRNTALNADDICPAEWVRL